MEDTIILTTKQFDLVQKLMTYVSIISNEQYDLKLFCGVCRDYYDTIFHNFDDIVYFVKKFPKSYLVKVLMQDDLINFLRICKNN